MKRWIDALLYLPKHEKPSDQNILRLLAPSFVGIVLCAVCLAGTTWAWFSARIQTSPQTMAMANYDIAVSITDEDGAPLDPGQQLEAGHKYLITLAASGTADEFGGYCVIAGGQTLLYTQQIMPRDSMSFALIPSSAEVYSFTAVLGAYLGEEEVVSNGDVIGEAQPNTNAELPAQSAEEGVPKTDDATQETSDVSLPTETVVSSEPTAHVSSIDALESDSVPLESFSGQSSLEEVPQPIE